MADEPERVDVDLEMGESDHHFTRAVELAAADDVGAAFAQLLWAYGSLAKVVHSLVAVWRVDTDAPNG